MSWKLKFVYFPIATLLVGSFLLISFYNVSITYDLRSFAFFMGAASGELAGTEVNPMVIVTIDINKILGFGKYGISEDSIYIYDANENPVAFTVSSLPDELTGRNRIILFAYPSSDGVYGEWYVTIEIFNLENGDKVNVMILSFVVQ